MKCQYRNTSGKSLISAFLVLILLIATVVVVTLLGRKALFPLFEKYPKDFSILIVFAGFVALSLIAAVVTFGILRSSGIFKNNTERQQYEFRGAMAGFLVVLITLISSYTYSSRQEPPEIQGNVRLRDASTKEDIGPAGHATIVLVGIPGLQTETDTNGNFTLPLREGIQEIEVQVTHQGRTKYHPVQDPTSRQIIYFLKIEEAKVPTKEELKKLPPSRLHSPVSLVSTSIKFVNKLNRTVAVYWLDFVGEEQLYVELAPKQFYSQQTYEGHIWIVKDKTNNDILRNITATQEPQVVNIE